jgi:hypothetical protein
MSDCSSKLLKRVLDSLTVLLLQARSKAVMLAVTWDVGKIREGARKVSVVCFPHKCTETASDLCWEFQISTTIVAGTRKPDGGPLDDHHCCPNCMV